MHSILALSFLAAAGFTAAQNAPQQNYPYTIDPNSVDESLRQYWCDQQVSVCPQICTQLPGVTSTTTLANECDPDALTYSCICENNVAPNITQYSQTLPFNICQEWGNQCQDNCGGDAACVASCRQDHPCGAQDPYKGNASISAAMSSKSAAATQTPTASIPVDGFGGTPATSTPKSPGAAPAMFNFGQTYGLAVLAAGVVASFAVLL